MVEDETSQVNVTGRLRGLWITKWINLVNYATYTSLQKAQRVQRLISLWSGLGEAPARGPKGAGAPLAALGLQYFWIFLMNRSNEIL